MLKDAPRATKTSEKPRTKASAFRRTRRRAALSRSSVRAEIDMPVMNERYEGKRGSTQGERNEKSPALRATAMPRDSPTISAPRPRRRAPTRSTAPALAPRTRARSTTHALEQCPRGRSVPGTGPQCHGHHSAARVDDEARGQRAYPVGLRQVHAGIQGHRKREAALLEERRHQIGTGVQRHRHDGEAAVLLAGVEPLHRGHLLATRRAPRGPEVDEDDLASVVAQAKLSAVRRGQGEILGGPGPRWLHQIQFAHGLLDARPWRMRGCRGRRGVSEERTRYWSGREGRRGAAPARPDIRPRRHDDRNHHGETGQDERRSEGEGAGHAKSPDFLKHREVYHYIRWRRCQLPGAP